MSTLTLPDPDRAVMARRNDIVKQLKRLVPEATLIADEEGCRTFESDALTAYRCPAARRRAARKHRGGLGDPALLPRQPRQGRAARRRHLALRRRAAARGRDRALPVAHAQGARDRHVNRVARVEAGATNIAITEAASRRRLLLRARPVEPDRLHRRRQHRHQFRRRALSQIRRHREQPARCPHGHDGRRDHRHRRRLSRCAGLRLPAADHRLRRPARHRHRGDGALARKRRKARGPCCSASTPRRPPRPASPPSSPAASSPWPSSSWTVRPSMSASTSSAAGYPLDAEALLIVEVEGSEDEIEYLLEKIEDIAARLPAQLLAPESERARRAR